ncbi:MAG: chitobiase/beta-hexosaminidase C-terminal domain-containing protein [Opitutaceae bacterium]
MVTLIGSLALPARAQLGTGWTPDNETYIVQTSSGTSITPISGGYEFKIPTETGLCRAEMRGNNLPTNTTNQWQGFGTLVSFPAGSNFICMHQVFGGPSSSDPDLILDEAQGAAGPEIISESTGRQYFANITVGVQFQLNTIYDPVGNLITVYVNGSESGTHVPLAGVHYNKYGQYVSLSGAGPATMDWVNVQSWAGGSTKGAPPPPPPPPPPPAGCSEAYREGTWQDTAMASQTGTFTVTFDATPSASPTNAVVAINNGAQTVYANLSCIVRLNATGQIDAYNGTAYVGPSTPIPYAAGKTYHFRLVIDVAAQTYSIYVTPAGGSELTVGLNYAFRAKGNPLNNWGVFVDSGLNGGLGSLTVCNFSIGGNPPPQQVATPTFSPAGGTYASAQSVAISDSTSGASIRYTTDGSTPSETAGTLYSGPVSIASTTTLKAIAYESGMTDSSVATATYTISLGGGGSLTGTSGDGFHSLAISPAATGTFTATFDATPSASPENAVVGLSSGAATAYGSIACIARFNPTGGIDAYNGTAYGAAATSYSAGLTYHFRLVVNVTAHTYSVYVTPAGGSELTVGLNYAFRSSANTMTSLDHWDLDVNATPAGCSLTAINLSVGGTPPPPQQVATPTFSPAGGTYSTAQSVAISDSTSGASIRYTTDGSTPSETSGTVYSGSVSIASSATLKAIAYESGMTDSSVATATYTISTPPPQQVATPTFSPAGGTYSTAQSVAISDSTSGASIRYTTDGSTPSETSGTVYSGPVSIGSSATLKAIAYKSGMTDSNIASASYTIALGNNRTLTGSSGNGWHALAISPAATGTFTATFDATPSVSPENAVVGLSSGAATAFSKLGCIVRFNPSGDIDAYNGSAYGVSVISYSAGVSYHFRLVVNVTAHTYSVYVTPAGGSELTVGTNYAFRSTANTMTSLNDWNLDVDSSIGGASLTASNLTP